MISVGEIIHRFESNAIPLVEYTMMRNGRGLYCFFQNGRCLYIGRSKSIQDRIDDHVSGNSGNTGLSRYISRHGDEIYITFAYLNYPDSALNNMENKLIRRLQPKFNKTLP